MFAKPAVKSLRNFWGFFVCPNQLVATLFAASKLNRTEWLRF